MAEEPISLENRVSPSNLTIPGKFLEVCEKYPEKDAFLYKKTHLFGRIQYKRLLNLVENFTFSLEKLGVKKGDRVVVVSENRPEWVVADLSVKSLGAALVPIHKVLTSEQVKTIVCEVEPTLFVVSDVQDLLKIQDAKKCLRQRAPIIFLEINEKHGAISRDDCDFISALQLIPHTDLKQIYQRTLEKVSSIDIGAIIHTPSSSGGYKGVILTHKNIIENARDTQEILKFRKDDRFLSVLPLSHALEGTVGCYMPLFAGATIKFLENMREFSRTMQEFKPTVLIGVPRIFEKTRQRASDWANQKRIRRFVFERAFKTNKRNRFNPMKFIFDRLVFKSVRSMYGGNIRFLISGGAALDKRVADFFEISGMPMLEGYGLTEASPVVSVNRPEKCKIGTVGLPLPRVKVKIADDGEILLSGPNITAGYYKKDLETAKALNDGWFHTGDYGTLDKEGFLKITGKKKEIIVLSNGKNVAPHTIESQLVKSNYIKQARVIGDGQKSIAALIVPNFEKLNKRFPDKTENDLGKEKEVLDFLQKEINNLLSKFSHYEQVKRFKIIGSNNHLDLRHYDSRKKIESVFKNEGGILQ